MYDKRHVSLLRDILKQADYLAIEYGRIVLHPKQGSELDVRKWLKRNFYQLAAAILNITGATGFIYQYYTTGYYYKGKSGLTLQFIDAVTQDDWYAVFNVELTKKKTTKHGLKGGSLSNGRFHPPLKGDFIKFWKRSELDLPRRNCEYHDRMGKLKEIIFEAEIDVEVDEKLKQKTLKPISVSLNSIVSALKRYSIELSEAQELNIRYENSWDFAGKSPAINEQTSGINLASPSGKEVDEMQGLQGLQANSTVGQSNWGNKVNSTRVNDHTDKHLSVGVMKCAQNNEVDDWFDDYDNYKPGDPLMKK